MRCSDSCRLFTLALAGLIGLTACTVGNMTAPLILMPSGVSDIHVAAQKEDTAKLRALLDAGVSVDTPTGYTMTTALMESVARGNSTNVKLLLERRANPNLRNAREETAVDLALFSVNPEILRELLNHGGVINKPRYPDLFHDRLLTPRNSEKREETDERIARSLQIMLTSKYAFVLDDHLAKILEYARRGNYVTIVSVLQSIRPQ